MIRVVLEDVEMGWTAIAADEMAVVLVMIVTVVMKRDEDVKWEL